MPPTSSHAVTADDHVGATNTQRRNQWTLGIDRGDAQPVSRPLPGGLVLRTAQPADRDQIATLLTERGEAADAVDHRLVVDDPDAGWQSCGVVVDGDRVVSTAMLLDETLVLDGVEIPAGQVELVATDREYEGRGLARALMGWAHELSASRGHLAQVMIGIPYFYRQFGYQYAILMPQSREVRAVPPPPDGHIVRAAHLDDIPAMADLQDAAQKGYDLRMPHSPACWRWLVLRDGSTQLLVERAGIRGRDRAGHPTRGRRGVARRGRGRRRRRGPRAARPRGDHRRRGCTARHGTTPGQGAPRLPRRRCARGVPGAAAAPGLALLHPRR